MQVSAGICCPSRLTCHCQLLQPWLHVVPPLAGPLGHVGAQTCTAIQSPTRLSAAVPANFEIALRHRQHVHESQTAHYLPYLLSSHTQLISISKGFPSSSCTCLDEIKSTGATTVV
jgi:hypothetical protein